MHIDIRDNDIARMLRVLDYIDLHITDELNADLLAQIATTSNSHFKRKFTSVFGLSAKQYVEHKRIIRASYGLAFRPKKSILEIALENGFSGPEAFARSFRRSMKQSPSEFRKTPSWGQRPENLRLVEQLRSQHIGADELVTGIRIVDFGSTKVAFKTHHGDVELIGESLAEFIGWRRCTNLVPKTAAIYNIHHGDPKHSPTKETRLDIAVACGRVVESNSFGVQNGEIQATKCATLRVVGDHKLRAAFSFLYELFSGNDNYEVAKLPAISQRITLLPDAPNYKTVTDIFLPLVRRGASECDRLVKECRA